MVNDENKWKQNVLNCEWVLCFTLKKKQMKPLYGRGK
jgi:hypothetical protein